MFPPVWGTVVHDTLQMIALGYPSSPSDDQKVSMNLLLNNMFKNLPCPACRIHAQQYFEKHPPDLSSAESLYKWLTDFHNVINDRTGKRSDWTVQEARKSLTDRYFNNISGLSKSQKLRQEDHKQIIAIKSENQILRKKLGMPVDEENDILSAASKVVGSALNENYENSGENDKTENYTLATLIISTTVGLLVIALLILYYKKKK